MPTSGCWPIVSKTPFNAHPTYVNYKECIVEIRYYLKLLLQGWWIIALSTLAALIVALVSNFMTTPMYSATARIVVSPNLSQISGSDIIYSLDALDKRSIASTYAELLNSERIFDLTATELKVEPKLRLKYNRSAVVLPDANILELTVEGPDPQTTALLANGISQRSIAQIQGLYRVYDITLMDPATVPTAPFSPQPLRDAGLAGMLGLVLGIAIAVMREQLQAPFLSLRARAQIDSESTAFSRRYFQHLLERQIKEEPDSPLTLGLIQLDGLQDMVNLLPPLIIRQMLVHTVELLRKELRGSDIVARWNETGFALLLPDTTSQAGFLTLSRVQKALTIPIEIAQSKITIALEPHVGLAVRGSQESAVDFLQHAILALEETQQEVGSSTIVLFDN
jgi:capsular polysaccharide biosynthesis protein